ncbi:unnamed protein product, partial [Staurois parvus]
VPLSGLLTLLGVLNFFIGCWQITGLSHSCCQALICHGPLYHLLMLLHRLPQSLNAKCHFQVSSHCWWCSEKVFLT